MNKKAGFVFPQTWRGWFSETTGPIPMFVHVHLAPQEGRLTPSVIERIKNILRVLRMENIFLSRNWYFSRKLDVLSLPRKFIWIKSVASSILNFEIVARP